MQYGPAWLFYESPLDNPFGDEQRAVDFLPFLKHPKSRVPDIATCSYGMFSSCGLLPSKKANCLVRWKLSCLSLKLYTMLVFRASCSTENDATCQTFVPSRQDAHCGAGQLVAHLGRSGTRFSCASVPKCGIIWRRLHAYEAALRLRTRAPPLLFGAPRRRKHATHIVLSYFERPTEDL